MGQFLDEFKKDVKPDHLTMSTKQINACNSQLQQAVASNFVQHRRFDPKIQCVIDSWDKQLILETDCSYR